MPGYKGVGIAWESHEGGMVAAGQFGRAAARMSSRNLALQSWPISYFWAAVINFMRLTAFRGLKWWCSGCKYGRRWLRVDDPICRH